MASKIIANLIILGSGIVLRAFTQAYQKALQNAAKSGAAREATATMAQRQSKAMTLQEARNILGVSEETPWQEVLERYKRLYDNNERVGSFYLQSKVQRAKECLEATVGKDATGAASSTRPQ